MSEEPKKLFLLDAFALIFRSYYAFIKNPRINSKGLNTSAMFGFTNTLLDVINRQKPTHLAVVFDFPAATFRNEIYPEYKANRDETPEDIKLSVPWIKKIIEAFNIPILEAKGYEADDVIGTLAKMAEKEGFVTYMMTPDKDFAQLVSDNIFMFKPPRMGNSSEILGPKEVCEKYELKDPIQVIDLLGLMGDAADNIPGIPGVGLKTAIKFIKQYGSIEELLKNTADLKGKMKEKVEAGHDSAILSKVLATIALDAPVELKAEELLLETPNKELLGKVFAELEFRRLAERLVGSTAPIPAAVASKESAQMDMFATVGETVAKIPNPMASLDNSHHSYYLIDSVDGVENLVELMLDEKSVCFDTETTSLDPLIAELVGVALSYKKGEGYYIACPENKKETAALIAPLKKLLEHKVIQKVGQNLKYDLLVLKKYGIEVQGPLFDTMLAHYLIEPDIRRRSMDALSESYLNYKPQSIEELIGKKGKSQKSMRDIEVIKVKEYAVEDADITFQLKQKFDPELDNNNARKVFEDIETPLIPVLAGMENEGVNLNTEALNEMSKGLVTDILEMQTKIYDLAGGEFLISSPKQVGEVLFERLKITDKPKKTKTGQYATNEEILSQLEGSHPIINEILDYRELVKLKSTYVDPLPLIVNPNTGRIHTSYNQVVAATGRLSSDNPNLQNIPIRTERGREIRKAFIPRDENHVLLASDYSQIELRIMAELSGDEGMLDAFTNNLDIHTATAARVFGISLDEVNRDMRSKAKMVNFGIIYGISAFGLSQRIKISRTEAKELIENYFDKYPGIKTYMDSQIQLARENGFVETIMGRRRKLRDINSGNAIVRGHAERNAINAPIQGSAADMIKIAMIKINRQLIDKKYKSKMILQVHDELVFDTVKTELNDLQVMVENEMKNAIIMKVPIEVESGVGTNWLQAH